MSSILAAAAQFILRALLDGGITDRAADSALITFIGLIGVAWVGALMTVVGYVMARFAAQRRGVVSGGGG